MTASGILMHTERYAGGLRCAGGTTVYRLSGCLGHLVLLLEQCAWMHPMNIFGSGEIICRDIEPARNVIVKASFGSAKSNVILRINCAVVMLHFLQ